MDKVIEIDGKKYKLLPIDSEGTDTHGEEVDNPDIVTFYLGCDSDCGYFEFNILIDQFNQGEILKDTSSVTYYPNGVWLKNESKYSESWDSHSFLKDILDDPLNKHVIEVKEQILSDGKANYNDLVNLLMQVRKRGWI